MDIHEDNTDELTGDGMIIIDGADVETVYYSLTVAPTPGPMIAEGSICGPERLMRKVVKANAAKLALADGPILTIRCEGGRDGVRWVKVVSG